MAGSEQGGRGAGEGLGSADPPSPLPPRSGPIESLSKPEPQPRPLALRKADRKLGLLSPSSF